MANKIQKEVVVGGGCIETFNFGFYNLLKYFDYECWTPY